jgi:glyceraldehyde-3-phosphate dehydrogenase/erythrose-4-phosphate dehydrogenase
VIGEDRIRVTGERTITDNNWSACDLVIEASGKMKTKAVLQAFLDQGVKRVVVTQPVKEAGVLNVVMGVNDNLFDPALHTIVTAASCTTNCLAPVVKVIHESLGIKHGSMHNSLGYQYTNHTRRTPQGSAALTRLRFKPDTDHHRIRHCDYTYIPGAQREVKRPCRASTAGECVTDGLCV